MKIILCMGLPGSGKSTWAKAQVERFPDRYKRINRDDLRAMIDFGKWSARSEQLIRLAELNLAELLLSHGYTIIVDDCNLSPSARTMWQEFARKIGAEIAVQDFTDVPLETCVQRDRIRVNSVGETVIRKTWQDFLASKPPLVE
jgi:predicted kinase